MITSYSIATLVIFILSIAFVIYPVSIPRRGRFPGFPINLTTAPIIAILILWAAQCLNPAVIRTGIVGTDGVKPYNIIILFFSLAYMAITLDITGILQAAAYWVSNKGGSNGWRLYFYFYVMLTFISIIIGNDPVILSGTAFLVYYTDVAGLNPTSWLMAEFAAANTASMVLFVGNPTNVVICEGFGVNNAAFTAYTILPFVACNVFCFFALAAQYHDHKYVPRKLDHAKNLDVHSVLLDPISACVGSLMLGTTLVLCLVVSFFEIDVWMISLPFAVAKFIYDIAWDHFYPAVGSKWRKPIVAEGEEVSNESSGVHSQSSTLPSTPEKVNSLPESGLSSTNEPLLLPKSFIAKWRLKLRITHTRLRKHFPTFFTALPRLPFALVPFAFSQFILIQALSYQGWIEVFGTWLLRATHGEMYSTIWLIGVLGVILCNISGTNIGATILLTEVVRAAAPSLSASTIRAAAIALAVASNIGAVSFTFSASLAGLLWKGILDQKGVQNMSQWDFAKRNTLPLVTMTVAGLSVVCAEMAILY